MPRPSLAETFGLSPAATRAREALLALRGDPYTPPSRFDRSSLRILRPGLSLRTWLRRTRPDRRIPIYNYFNHTQTPIEDGWSVRVTQVRDYRGGRHTYDSHNGTDFVVPVGTVVVAPAPGRVIRVSSEFNRGGLKVVLNHGDGLITMCVHLSRALVGIDSIVRRGEPIALSGASGIDMVAAFPWTAPHVHFNVWLDGEPVDPFAVPGEIALWNDGNDPRPAAESPGEPIPDESDWDESAVARAIAACRDPALAGRLSEAHPLARRAADTIFHMNYYPTRFTERPRLFSQAHPRRPRLDLPFRPEDFDGIVDEDGDPA